MRENHPCLDPRCRRSRVNDAKFARRNAIKSGAVGWRTFYVIDKSMHIFLKPPANPPLPLSDVAIYGSEGVPSVHMSARSRLKVELVSDLLRMR